MKKNKPSRKKKNSLKNKNKARAFSLFNFWKSRSNAVRFLLVFTGCMALFYALYFSDFFIVHIRPTFIGVQANAGSFLIGLFGQNTSATGSVISGNDFSLDISHGCDGMEVTAILIASIIASRAFIKNKLIGILAGTIVLALINLIRFPALFFAGKNGNTDLFDFLHIQGGFIIFVTLTILLWLLWMNWAKKVEGALVKI